jgi:hypothetical protein
MTYLVLTHTGSPIPDYVEHCIKQIQHTNPETTIDLIADYQYGNQFLEDKRLCCVNIIPIQELEHDPIVEEFRKVSWFKAWGKPNTTYPSPENFVQGTSERLFLLAAYLRMENLEKIWHIENDNLIYDNFEYVEKHLDQDKITCCYMNEKHTVWNIIYVPKPDMLYAAMQWYADQLSRGNEWLCKTYGLDMVHEMTVMRQYENLAFFPSLPSEYKGWYLFDPASYGQYIGGTNNGHPPGFRDTINHDIGKLFNKEWNHARFEKYTPVVISDKYKMLYPLFNLHVHNKHMMKALSTYE